MINHLNLYTYSEFLMDKRILSPLKDFLFSFRELSEIYTLMLIYVKNYSS